MKEIAKAKGLPYDMRVYYHDKLIKALVEMKPNAGEGPPTYAVQGRLCQLWQIAQALPRRLKI
jgi:hypothetical protein